MVRECFRTNTGIRFHAELLKELGLDPAHLWPHAAPPVEFGPGLVHAPRLPPVAHISLDPPTPLERPHENLEDLERRVLSALRADAHVGSAPASTHVQVASSSSEGSHRGHSRERTAVNEKQDEEEGDEDDEDDEKQAHVRHVSVSTTRTLVGTAPRGFHQGSEAHTKEAGEVAVNEAKEEHKDAMCPIYDQLALKWWWWLIEILPLEQRKQLPNNKWKRYTT